MTFELWLYNREPDYAPIDDALMRVRMLMTALPGRQVSATEDAWVLQTIWGGAGTDGQDDLYKAVLRSESYTITASGN